ncbi:hypothetical protein CALCODRAFT_484577 [Calocera cornea HHB12733]|uniref:Uncharacterized protein n=1 Tax=Calocera cornea HHB12733 TaxID=1353952 RepID=A0A165EX76_9BASI|nr:hypothetical protein CALCODRAFT_484577 [Calocera cornea HHB12733]
MPNGKKIKWPFHLKKPNTAEPDVEAGGTPLLPIPASSLPEARTVPARVFRISHHRLQQESNDDGEAEEGVGILRAFGEMAELDDIGGEVEDADDEDDDDEDKPEEDAEEDAKRAARRKLKGKAKAVAHDELGGPSHQRGYYEVRDEDNVGTTSGDGANAASTPYELAPSAMNLADRGSQDQGGSIRMALTGKKEQDWDLLRNMMRFEVLPAYTEEARPGAPAIRLDPDDDHLSWDEEQGPGKEPIHRIIRAAGDEVDSEEEDTLLQHTTPFQFHKASDMVKKIENKRQGEVGLIEGEATAVDQLTNFEQGGLAGRQDMGEWVQSWKRRPKWVKGYCVACCCTPMYRTDCGRVTVAVLGWIWRGFRALERFVRKHPGITLLLLGLIVLLIVLGPHRVVQIVKAVANWRTDMPK